MEKKSIIKRVKEIIHEVWMWFRFLFLQTLVIGALLVCYYIPEIWTHIAEIWRESNLLYVPDLSRALGTGIIGILGTIGAIAFAIIFVMEIIYIIKKVYAYFCQKDKFALWDILRTLVYE